MTSLVLQKHLFFLKNKLNIANTLFFANFSKFGQMYIFPFKKKILIKNKSGKVSDLATQQVTFGNGKSLES